MLRLRFSIAPILVVLAILAFGSAQERRATWDPASFLQRLDRNGNAVLEPDEMAGRAKGFIEKLGIDASGPVAIENVMNTINRQRQQADQDLAAQGAAKTNSTEWSTPRLIPGFGEAVETPTLPGFGLPAGASTAVTAEAKPEAVGDSVIAQVDRVLSQYDPNKDLVLDATEIQRTPWGPPSPQESDTNGDGRITRAELIERYRKRDADSARFNGGNNRGGPQLGGPQPDDASRRRTPTATSGSTNPPTATANTERPSPVRKSSSEDRIADYVKNLLKQYDSDSDGSISADEQAKMKSGPKGADADSDGRLSRDELTSYYGGGYKKPTTNEPAPEASATPITVQANNENTSRPQRRSSRRRTSESSGSPSQVDGQKPMPMHEFTTEWTEAKLTEFREMDANHDGVISVEEFRERK